MARTSSLSEKPISDKPRRLADWLNPTGEKKVHSLIDKVYKQKNLKLDAIRARVVSTVKASRSLKATAVSISLDYMMN